jgi:integrase
MKTQTIAHPHPVIAQELHTQEKGKAPREKKQKKPIAKTSAAYWAGKVQKPGGSAHYGIQIFYKGFRHRFPLETANKDEAGEKARERYVFLVANGWDAALSRFKPKTVKVKKSATVGALIEAATRLSSARPESLHVYAQALRRLTSGVLEIESKSKYSRHKRDWRATVDSTPLDKLTPSAVLAFKNSFLKSAKTPEERNSAAITFNSLLRNSKALLSKKVRPFIEQEINLPSGLWFEGVPMEKEPSLRYVSKIDPEAILADAQKELTTAHPETFKALILTLVCGLRRSEADTLLWRQFDFETETLEIADNEHKRLKSAESAGVIGLDKGLSALLKGMKARTNGEFVLEGVKAPGQVYRAESTFQALITWLRSKKVPGLRPVHSLRKEIGSVIASREGIFAASRYLRHSNISITARLYADAKKPVSAGLGSFLPVPAENIIEGDFKAPQVAADGEGRVAL